MRTVTCDYVDPLALYSVLRKGESAPFILESASKRGPGNGFTYVSSDPEYIVEVDGLGTRVGGSQVCDDISPFSALKALGSPYVTKGSGFAGGYVGNVAYDAVHA